MHNNELYHHGILGQKWGVRRYQNPDGSLTEEGRRHYGYDSKGVYRARVYNAKAERKARDRAIQKSYNEEEKSIESKYGFGKRLSDEDYERLVEANNRAQEAWKSSKDLYKSEKREAFKELIDSNKGNIAKAALITAGVVAANHLMTHPETVDAIVKDVGKTLSKAGEAAANAAMATAGSIAVVKIAETYSPNETDSEATRNAKQIAVSAASAAITSATSPKTTSTGSNKNEDGSIGKELSDKLGPPSNKGVDKGGAEWNSLFKDIALSNMPNEQKETTRATIKSLAKAGYDMDQIKQYYNTLSHSGIGYRVIFSSELSHKDIGGKSWSIKMR